MPRCFLYCVEWKQLLVAWYTQKREKKSNKTMLHFAVKNYLSLNSSFDLSGKEKDSIWQIISSPHANGSSYSSEKREPDVYIRTNNNDFHGIWIYQG